MKIEVGKKYKTRDGDIVKVIYDFEKDNYFKLDMIYRFVVFRSDTVTYSVNNTGRYYFNGENYRDLVEEYEEVKEDLQEVYGDIDEIFTVSVSSPIEIENSSNEDLVVVKKSKLKKCYFGKITGEFFSETQVNEIFKSAFPSCVHEDKEIFDYFLERFNKGYAFECEDL